MELSRHNIIAKVHQSDEYFIVNLLSGNADLLTAQEAFKLTGNSVPSDPEYLEKGYVVDPESETKRFRNKYLDFLDSRETDEVQLFYVSTYSCNFGCSYCYQEGYSAQGDHAKTEVAAAFFDYVQSNFKGRRKYITLFGGEPLLPGNKNQLFLDYFVSRCRELKIDLAIVTNGYHLAEYIPILSLGSIREIQVTLDGPAETHDVRRPLKGGQGTFDRIVAGIDAAIEAKLAVNLRVVLDRENLNALPRLAQFAIDRGWTTSPLFKTQIGRNYELHHCQSDQARLYSRIDLYKDLYKLIREFPFFLQFHKPAYSVSKFLFENGDLPDPLFDSCPGCKTEWAFDYNGKIYSCTATVGKAGEELGSFYPEVQMDNDKVSDWQQRDVLSITECTSCNLRLACGGGCASVAKNRDKHLHAPDCRPVTELLELGISLYSEM